MKITDIDAKNELHLTINQKIWLIQHGGRNETHIVRDEDGKFFVLMYDPDSLMKMERVYLPQT